MSTIEVYVYDTHRLVTYRGRDILTERFVVRDLPPGASECLHNRRFVEIVAGSEADDDNIHAIHGFDQDEIAGHPLVGVKIVEAPAVT